MRRSVQLIFTILVLLCSSYFTKAQNVVNDSNRIINHGVVIDTTTKPTPKKHIPRIATIRSAIFPGLGQIYNKEYWKLPIVYGAIAIPTYTYFYNDHYYGITKYAYEARYKQLVNGDNSGVAGIDPLLVNLDINSLLKYRNSFRRDRDYSIMWFVIVWGLNVVDATVFAHLKDFSVSDNLTMKVEPKIMPAGTFTVSTGLGLTFSLKNPTIRKFEIK